VEKRNMSLHINLSRLIVLATTLVLIGCAPAQLMPQFDDTTLRTKQRDISTQQKRLPQQITEDPSTALSRIYDRLEPSATRLCIENGEKWLDSSCSNWRVEVVKDETFNAYATSNRKIVFTTEVFKYTRSDDELAFILGHELGHHILNHLMEDKMNAEITGAAVGIFSAILTGAIAGALGADEETTSDVMKDSMEDGWESGRESGRLTYSIDQESEADKLALQLIALSGYSVSEARKIMLHIHGDSEGVELRSAHQASHPTGPERLAAFDLYARSFKGYSYVRNASSNSYSSQAGKRCFTKLASGGSTTSWVDAGNECPTDKASDAATYTGQQGKRCFTKLADAGSATSWVKADSQCPKHER